MACRVLRTIKASVPCQTSFLSFMIPVGSQQEYVTIPVGRQQENEGQHAIAQDSADQTIMVSPRHGIGSKSPLGTIPSQRADRRYFEQARRRAPRGNYPRGRAAGSLV